MSENGSQSNSVSIALTGSGGAGVITAGAMLLDAAARAGCYGLFVRSSGPQIRGGEAAAMVRLSAQHVEAQDDVFHILIGLDWHNIERFAVELPLATDSLVIADPANGPPPAVIVKTGARIVELHLKDMAKEIPQGRPNMIALGLVAGLTGLAEDALKAALAKVLGSKRSTALQASLAAVQAGIAAAAGVGFDRRLPAAANSGHGRWQISGNQAAGLGAIRGGVRFVAAYPITPATEVLEWLAANLTKVGGTLVQAEDELASINMIIGASYGGTPALTATSGPGLALMTESIGLAVASEVPIVVIDVMRGGPSTGIPTKSEQSDLNIALFGLHGDAPHIVVAPTSIANCVFTANWAVHLAESMQVPTLLLSDQFLGQSRAIIEPPADLAFATRRLTAEITESTAAGYQRYALAAGGVSPMAIPGTPGGQYTADGLEHTPRGMPSSQVADHMSQLDKRRDKILGFEYGDHWADIAGDAESELAVITWGSAAGPVREALSRLRARGQVFRLIAPRLLAPASPTRMAAALRGVKRALVIEQSHSAQFFHYLKGYFDLPCPVASYHRPGPLPLRPHELVEQIAKWSAA
ncbi:MAG TPA: 2-oxoacid:acceptor oxidoreductase subunit alpha [Kiloniellales bacterium]|jgi:2-oxoglutarate ferredoxin oxidoreductase subunit alpha